MHKQTEQQTRGGKKPPQNFKELLSFCWAIETSNDHLQYGTDARYDEAIAEQTSHVNTRRMYTCYVILDKPFQRYTIIDAEARKKMKESTRFDDIAGAHEAKVEMKEIVDYLKRPQAYTVS